MACALARSYHYHANTNTMEAGVKKYSYNSSSFIHHFNVTEISANIGITYHLTIRRLILQHEPI